MTNAKTSIVVDREQLGPYILELKAQITHQLNRIDRIRSESPLRGTPFDLIEFICNQASSDGQIDAETMKTLGKFIERLGEIHEILWPLQEKLSTAEAVAKVADPQSSLHHMFVNLDDAVNQITSFINNPSEGIE